MFGEFSQTFMHRAAECGDFLRVEREGFLSPAVGDGFKQRDQGGGCGEDHTFVDAAFDQAGIGMECGGEKRFAG